MIKRKTWKEFKSSGLLWWINMVLHTFGWAIVLEIVDGEVEDVYPARVKYRGFDEKNNTVGYQKVSMFMKNESDQLLKESMD